MFIYTSCYGGAVRFRKGEDKFENISQQDLPVMRILLTNTRVPRSTKLLVASVKVLYEELPQVITYIYICMYMYMYVYVCMYVCICIYIYIYIYICHMYIYVHTYIYDIYSYLYICLYVYM
jgi:hypothetical protein